MTTQTYVTDHHMDGGTFTVTRKITLMVRRGGVTYIRYGKSTFIRARFPRLAARKIARQIKREGYRRAVA